MQKFTILYNPNLAQTLSDKYEQLSIELTGEEFNGLLIFVYIHLSSKLGNLGDLYKKGKLTTDYFTWRNDDDIDNEEIKDLIKSNNNLRCNIADFVVDELILDSISTGAGSVYISEINRKPELERFILFFSDPKLDIDINKYKDINIITESQRKYWFILSSQTSAYLKGIKLGCKLYNVKEGDYIFPIANKDKL